MTILDYVRRRSKEEIERDACLDEIFKELNEKAGIYCQEHPDEAETVKNFAKLLSQSCRKHYVTLLKAEGMRSTEEGYIQFFLSNDRMCAYICIFPIPLSDNAVVTEAKLRDELNFAGIQHGILEDTLRRCVREKRFFEILPIARGTRPMDGKEGSLTECFSHHLDADLSVAPDTVIDFSAGPLVQMVHEGDVLCRIQPPVPGTDGVDVTGIVIPCRKAGELVIPQGKNTRLAPDGKALVAAMDGILYSNGKDYCVRPQRVFSDNLNFNGKLKLEGDLYIPGNISGGADLEVYGDVIIAGEVRDARIVSTGGTIRVQKGIHGEAGKTMLTAARQVQTPIIENARVEAKGHIITGSIIDSEVCSGGCISVMGGRGMILGGRIRAAKQVVCHQIGNFTGKESWITVSSSLEAVDEYERGKKELAETRETLKKLWDNISALRKLGSSMSPGQQELLGWLSEQRDLYAQQERDLKAAQKGQLDRAAAASAGTVVCDQLYPVTTVQIGIYRQEFTVAENNCRIRVSGERLLIH